MLLMNSRTNINERATPILLVGIGNTLRGDDGVAAFVCREFLRRHPGMVDCMLVQQLTTDLLDEWMQYDQIVLVDAAVSGPSLAFRKVSPGANPSATSHHVNAALLVSLARTLYDQDLALMVLGIRGEDFGMKEELTGIAQQRGVEAVQLLWEWVRSLQS
jgi:hydrogenase maturation protease